MLSRDSHAAALLQETKFREGLMSEKQPGRSRSNYRPDVSQPPPPPQEMVDELLKNAGNGSAEGIVIYRVYYALGDRDH